MTAGSGGAPAAAGQFKDVAVERLEEGLSAARNEFQTVSISGGPTGGTFTLTFKGVTTGTIAYNAAASAVQTALEAISTIGSGGVSVKGGALPGAAVYVEFLAPKVTGDLPLLTANGSGLTGGSSPAVAVARTLPANSEARSQFDAGLSAGGKVPTPSAVVYTDQELDYGTEVKRSKPSVW